MELTMSETIKHKTSFEAPVQSNVHIKPEPSSHHIPKVKHHIFGVFGND